MNDKKRNAAIFEDTRSLCKNNGILSMIISHSNTFQTTYDECRLSNKYSSLYVTARLADTPSG